METEKEVKKKPRRK